MKTRACHSQMKTESRSKGFSFEALELRQLMSAAVPTDGLFTTPMPIYLVSPTSVVDPIFNGADPETSTPAFSGLSATSGVSASTSTVVSDTLATFSAATDVSSFTASIDWGDGLTGTGDIVRQADGSFAVKGSHDYGTPETWYIGVTLIDAAGNSDYVSKTAISQAAALTSINGTDISPTVGANSGLYVDTIYDLNPSDPSDYKVSIDWGDGSAPSAGYVAPSAFGTGLDVFGSHAYTSANSFTVTYTITKNDDPSATLTSTVEADVSPNGDPTYSNFNSDATALADTTSNVTGVLATFDGTLDASGYTANVDWGDGNTSAARIVQQPDGSFAIVGSHDYASAGTWQVDINLTDPTGNFDDVYDTTVSQAATLTSLAAPSIYASTGHTDGLYVGTFLDLNQADASDYTVTISWGDGTTSAGTLTPSQNGGSYDVSGDHNYQTAGNYAVSYTVTNNDDPSAGLVSTGSADVADPSSDPLINGMADMEVSYMMMTMNDNWPDASDGVNSAAATGAPPAIPQSTAAAPAPASVILSPAAAAIAVSPATSASAPVLVTITNSSTFAPVESAESGLAADNQVNVLPTTEQLDKLDSLSAGS